MLGIFVCLISAALAIPFTDYRHLDSAAIRLTHSSDYTRLKKRNDSSQISSLAGPSYNAVIRPTYQNAQYCIEVHFNEIPRYLLVDTGSADTWMIASDFQCLDAAGSPVPTSACLLGDPYTGPQIPQTGHDTYYQLYGTAETFDGTFGYANVTVAGRSVQNQKVALVNRGYALGDQVRSGVFGLAPAAVGALYENENASTTPPNGTATPYKTVFESMYSDHAIGYQHSVAPFFSLALERGVEGGYIAFGGLPPIEMSAEDFVFTPFQGLKYLGRERPERYYPIQPRGFELNGVKQATSYRAIVDSGTYALRLPQDLADQINAAFNPPAIYNKTLSLYVVPCSAMPPTFSLDIGGKSFTMHPNDMFLPISLGETCATSFTNGFEVGSAYEDGFYAIGAAFLHNVVAVFDVGGGGMHFGVHKY